MGIATVTYRYRDRTVPPSPKINFINTSTPHDTHRGIGVRGRFEWRGLERVWVWLEAVSNRTAPPTAIPSNISSHTTANNLKSIEPRYPRTMVMEL